MSPLANLLHLPIWLGVSISHNKPHTGTTSNFLPCHVFGFTMCVFYSEIVPISSKFMFYEILIDLCHCGIKLLQYFLTHYIYPDSLIPASHATSSPPCLSSRSWRIVFFLKLLHTAFVAWISSPVIGTQYLLFSSSRKRYCLFAPEKNFTTQRKW